MGRHLTLTWVILLLLLEWGGEGAALEITANDAADFLVGKDIILNIFYTSTSQSPTVTWTKNTVRVATWGNNNYTVSPAYRGRLKLFDQGSLNITNASPTDAGAYTVTVGSLDEKDATKSFQVKIYEPVGSVSVTSSPGTVTEGFPEVKLICAGANGEQTVRWEKDRAALPSDSAYSLLEGNLTLQIIHPNRSHNGNYSCNISNPFSSGQGSVPLHVYYGPESPSLTIKSNSDLNPMEYVLVGSNVTLQCSAAADPPALYSWVVPGQPTLPQAQNLSLPRIQRTQNGDYLCIARNSYGSIKSSTLLTVYQFPIGDPSCSVASIGNDTALQFGCSWSDSYPEVSLVFVGLPDSSPTASRLSVNTTKLTGLSGQTVTCVGAYRVPAQNKNCTIIPEAPVNLALELKASQRASGETIVALNSKGRFNPVSVQWQRLDNASSTPLSAAGRYNINPNGTQLTISNFSLQQDLGSYIFICHNALGSKNYTFNLTGPSTSSFNVVRSTDGQSADLSWTVPEGSVVTEVLVQMQGTPSARAAETWVTVANLTSDQFSFTKGNLQPNGSYSFRLLAKAGDQLGDPSPTKSIFPPSTWSLSPGAIAGIVIGSILGALLLIALLVLLVFCLRKKRKKEKDPAELHNNGVVRNRAVSGATLSPDDPAYFTINNIMYRNSSISMGSDIMTTGKSSLNGQSLSYNPPSSPTKLKHATQV